MAVSYKKKYKNLSRERKQKIKERAAEITVAHLALKQLRESRELTQVQLAEILDTTQHNISKLESRPDIKLSSLMKYVNALGGKLTISVELPDSNANEEIELLA